MKTKIEHSRSKSRHKYLGSSRITSTFGVIAFVALICVCMMSSTANCGVPQKIVELNSQITDFRARVEALSVEIKDAASGGLSSATDAIVANTDAAETAILTNTDNAEESINQFIRDTHLVDAFDVAVSVCTEIGGGAEIGASAGLKVPVTLEANLGIDFFGSGVEIGIEPSAEIGVGIGLQTDVGMSVTACINGIFTRQAQDTDEEDALIASVPAGEQNFVAELIEVGNNFRQRVRGTAENTNLVVVNDNGVDRLNNSLTAFEAVTTLNPALLATFILDSTGGDFGGLVGDLSSSGSGIDTVISDIVGIVDLSNSNVLDMVTSISGSIPGLNLGSGGAGLDGLSLTALEPVINAFGTFEDIDDAIDSVKTAVDDVISFFNDAIGALNDVIDCLEDPLSCI